MNLEQVIFVGGSGRSGTTLASELLDLNSTTASIFEVWPLIPLLGRLKNKTATHEPVGDLDDQMIDHILSPDSEYNWRCLKAELLYSWSQKLQATLAAGESLETAIRRWLDYLHSLQMIRDNSVRIVHKTPVLGAYLPEIWRLFPRGLFLHMIRDPRAVVASYLAQEWGPKTISEGVDWYCKRVGPAIIHGRGNERYLEVKMEDLVRKAADVLERIQGWADLEPETENILARYSVNPQAADSRKNKLDGDSARWIYEETMSRLPGLRDLYQP